MQEDNDGAHVPSKEVGGSARAMALEGDGIRRITSHALFAGASEVLVDHGGDQYRLRRTSKGKLILTK